MPGIFTQTEVSICVYIYIYIYICNIYIYIYIYKYKSWKSAWKSKIMPEYSTRVHKKTARVEELLLSVISWVLVSLSLWSLSLLLFLLLLSLWWWLLSLFCINLIRKSPAKDTKPWRRRAWRRRRPWWPSCGKAELCLFSFFLSLFRLFGFSFFWLFSFLFFFSFYKQYFMFFLFK